jgi:hypothetical protein
LLAALSQRLHARPSLASRALFHQLCSHSQTKSLQSHSNSSHRTHAMRSATQQQR